MRQIILIVHSVRSAHNVGSLLRTADGLGVDKVVFSGYTPYPLSKNDNRLPHISRKLDAQIHKTALGAQNSIPWDNIDQPDTYLEDLKNEGYEIVALEQTATAIKLNHYKPPSKVALIVGNEITGIENQILNKLDTHIEIPMLGRKESFNVSIATAIALYHLRYIAA